MTDETETEVEALGSLTTAWVQRHLQDGEQIIGSEALRGGITADIRKLTIGARDGNTRELVLRSYVDPFYVERAQDSLSREADALTALAGAEADGGAGAGVTAPRLVAVDSVAAHCEYPSLLMTHLPGRTVLADAGVEARVPLLARQLVAIHAVRPVERPREYVALTTAETVVVPEGADAAAWDAAIDVIRDGAPGYEGRFLHRDFQPGNVLFDVPLFDVPVSGPAAARISGVVDWAGTSWGPADLDVAHCSANLALLHGAEWGLRFAEAYEQAGGVLAATASERLYWLVRDALALSEEVSVVSQPWREGGRADLTTRAVEERLDAYVTALMDALG